MGGSLQRWGPYDLLSPSQSTHMSTCARTHTHTLHTNTQIHRHTHPYTSYTFNLPSQLFDPTIRRATWERDEEAETQTQRDIALLVEHLPATQVVLGSIPSTG